MPLPSAHTHKNRTDTINSHMYGQMIFNRMPKYTAKKGQSLQ